MLALRRFLPLLIFLLVVSTACALLNDATQPEGTTAFPTETDQSPSTAEPTATQPVPEPTATAITTVVGASPTPVDEIEPTATIGMALNDLALESEDVSIFPVPAVYAGDQVSLQVAPNLPRGLAPNDVDVRILIDGEELVTGNLNWRKLSGDTVGLYQWVWDTDDQEGPHTVTAVLDPDDRIQIGDENPDNNLASIEIVVEPLSKLPKIEADASWEIVSSACCNVHVVSGTAARRDLDHLLPQIDAAFTRASTILTEQLHGPYDVYLIDRVIGQGGYSIDSMVVSYLDRNYAGGGLNEVLVHEAIHLMDQQFAPDRITFLSEGLAVWGTGGHYQQENIDQRMAALVEIGDYVPLVEVIDNFYATQHEISYLEAASFIGYLVESYGWPRVRTFYTDTTPDDGPSLTTAVDRNLLSHFGKSLAEFEADWIAYLKGLPRDQSAKTNLQTTIRFYDVMRRYQTLYDPTAYYLYAWLPSPEIAEEENATADFSRHPETSTHVTIEVMLKAANDALIQQDSARANALLDSVVRVMNSDGQFLDPMAKSHLDIVQAAAEMGYETQQIVVQGNQALALVSRPSQLGTSQLQLKLNNNQEWTLAQ